MVELNEILHIPQRCLVNKKVTKAFFKRNFDLTSAEKNLLDDFSIVKTIDWQASISPSTANIPAYSDNQQVHEEIVTISVYISDTDFDKNKQKIAEIIQKYIPYSILLCIYNDSVYSLNACEKRVNQNDTTKRTVETRYFTDNISRVNPTDIQRDFLAGMRFANLDKTSLKTCYESYIQNIIALKAAELNGIFTPRTRERSSVDLQNLQKIESLQKEIITLQNQVKKETQLNQRVAINTHIQQKRQEIEQLKTLLTA